MTAATSTLIACHECDALVRTGPLRPGSAARCGRCGGLLRRVKHDSINRTLALTMAGVVLFILANVYPFMTFQLEGRVQVSSLVSGAIVLWDEGLQELGVLVFMTSIGFPAFELLGLLYVLLPLRIGGRPSPSAAQVFRMIQSLGPWGMLEVYMLGILVAIVKLSEMATLKPGVAFYSFCGLIVTTTAANAALDPGLIWSKLGAARAKSARPSS